MRYSLLAACGTLLAVCLLGGCSSRSDVSLTGNTTSQYSHVFITTQEVWFNQNDTAGPDDAGWTKFTLSSPTTVDLVQASGGTLGSITTGLRLLPGTYKQIRVIPLDASAALAASASALGAKYNAEADYTDGGGTLQQVPLELLNPDKGIAIAGSLKVPVASFGTAAAAALGTSTTNASTNTPFGTTTATNTTTSTGTSTTTGTSTAGTTTTTSFTLSLDGSRDLVPFTFGTCASGTAATAGANATCANGILLSSHVGAFNLDNVGGISGTLTLTNLANTSAIQATAESLSADGTRHVAVLSTPVRSDGTFLLYPLPSSSSTAAVYDVVIHGPGMATIIVKSVSVTIASSSTTDASTTNTGTTGTTSTATGTTTPTSTTTDTTTTTPSSTSNTVSLGTMTPRAATAFSANIATTAGSPLTADAQVGFFQGLSGSGEVPYQIEAAPIDPFNQVLASAQSLSAGTIDSGTYATSGSTIALFSAAPAQGAGTYWVAASAPSYGNGTLSKSLKVTAPATPTTTPVIATVPALSAASGVTLGSLLVTITPSSPGAYDSGELLVSHDGTLVSRVSLNGIVSSGGGVTTSVPTGTPASTYYFSVRFWQSGDPANTLRRQWYPNGVNMSGGGDASIALTIN